MSTPRRRPATTASQPYYHDNRPSSDLSLDSSAMYGGSKRSRRGVSSHDDDSSHLLRASPPSSRRSKRGTGLSAVHELSPNRTPFNGGIALRPVATSPYTSPRRRRRQRPDEISMDISMDDSAEELDPHRMLRRSPRKRASRLAAAEPPPDPARYYTAPAGNLGTLPQANAYHHHPLTAALAVTPSPSGSSTTTTASSSFSSTNSPAYQLRSSQPPDPRPRPRQRSAPYHHPARRPSPSPSTSSSSSYSPSIGPIRTAPWSMGSPTHEPQALPPIASPSPRRPRSLAPGGCSSPFALSLSPLRPAQPRLLASSSPKPTFRRAGTPYYEDGRKVNEGASLPLQLEQISLSPGPATSLHSH